MKTRSYGLPHSRRRASIKNLAHASRQVAKLTDEEFEERIEEEKAKVRAPRTTVVTAVGYAEWQAMVADAEAMIIGIRNPVGSTINDQAADVVVVVDFHSAFCLRLPRSGNHLNRDQD